MAERITPRAEDYSRWYNDIVVQSKLADYSPVRGCMVIRPHGYAIWENIQKGLNRRFRETGHVNAYFPLFIPKSMMEKEAEHVEGFSPECAVVTHGGGKELEEPLMVRPTSETVIGEMYSKWIKSYRDLPVLINQWANVVRWEMRTRMFLRTSEFLWQEGHTAHATEKEAVEETRRMHDVYQEFAEREMALPVIAGVKTERERFAGAVDTYTVEAMMQDRKALQSATSHNLGQNFAKAFEIRYQSEQGQMEYCWTTSWGASTRLIGALIMAHSDDQGLILPPRLAPVHVAVVPIWRGDDQRAAVLEPANRLAEQMRARWEVVVDDREGQSPGFKFHEWDLKGVPLRIELGPRDLEAGSATLVRRIDRAKEAVPLESVASRVDEALEEIQREIYQRALDYRERYSFDVGDWNQFQEKLEDPGGFLYAHWCGETLCEERIQEETKATIRCIPLDATEENGHCVRCGNPSRRRVVFARAY